MDDIRPLSGSAAVEAKNARKLPWVASYEEKDGPVPPGVLRVVPDLPPQTVNPNHENASPPPQMRISRDGFVEWDAAEPAMGPLKRKHVEMKRRRQNQRGRKWDYLRSSEPVIIPNHLVRTADSNSPWRTFIEASKYGRQPGEKCEKVDAARLEELMPGFNDVSSPRIPDVTEERMKRSRRKALHERMWRLLLNHPLVPALLRLFVLVTSIVSLALSGNLWHVYGGSVLSVDGEIGPTLRSQWIVAIVVDCIVTPYVVYMTWDEYHGPQLGLRSPMQKVSLTLLDLFFIIFKSASATLAFDSLYGRKSPREQKIKMEVLASFLLLGLIGWILNFIVNVFRLVQRLGPGSGDEERRPMAMV
ncbi:hypothetical protein SLS53_000836 [Cytospora paraplurivora]|uniref:Regulator of phospholipase D SRF1 n=1 Tax=Cytospora paraplurivora TaxID=2898453 RepID=A0AAN9UL18_9PEZI